MSDASAPRVASYQADPDRIGACCCSTPAASIPSVMVHWIQERYGAEIVTLTVDLGQPGEDWEVVVGKARDLGAADAIRADAREEFAARLRAAGDQGERALRRRLPAVHGARAAADREARRRARPRRRLRHDRPRLHRQGQRPGADRRHDRGAGPGAEGARAGARVEDGPRRGDRLRARARDPDQGRRRGRRRTRSTTTSGVARRRAGRSRTSPRRPPTTSSSSSPGPRMRPTRPSWSGSASSAAARSRSTARRSDWSS